MKCTKMQGLGNDYVYVSRFTEQITDPAALARWISNRHFHVGSDGLILIGPSDKADFRMEIFNADGSEGEMCGNGIRCVGKYVYDNGLTDKTSFTVESKAGVRQLDLLIENGKATQVKVDMGQPELIPQNIPINLPGETAIDVPIQAAGQEWHFTGVSMGNPHAVVFLPPETDLATFDLATIGPQFENHPLFPNRVNTEFVRIIDRETAQMRVWERGSGETMACGTGACAVMVACVLNGFTEPKVTVQLVGGDLEIEWNRETNHVYMTGPAAISFTADVETCSVSD